MSFTHQHQNDAVYTREWNSICIPDVPLELLNQETMIYVIEMVHCLGNVSYVEYVKKDMESRYTAIIHFDHWNNTPIIVEFRAAIEYYGYVDLNLPLWVVSDISLKQHSMRAMIYNYPLRESDMIIHELAAKILETEEEISELCRRITDIDIHENTDLEIKLGKVYPIISFPIHERESDGSDSDRPLHEEIDYEDTEYEDTDYNGDDEDSDGLFSEFMLKKQWVKYFPAVVEDFPAVVEDFPAVVEDFPAVVEDFPAVVEDFPMVVDQHWIIDILDEDCLVDVKSDVENEEDDENTPLIKKPKRDEPENEFCNHDTISNFNDDSVKYLIYHQIL